MAENSMKLVFPSDLESNDQYGEGSAFNNQNFPFVMIEFFNWTAMQQNAGGKAFTAQPVSTIFLPAPTSGLLESFNHDWEPGTDFNDFLAAAKSKALAYVTDKIKNYSDAGALGVAAFGVATGTGFNDMLAQSYGNMSLRLFDMSFDLICRSVDDTQRLENIIYTIKKLTIPTYGSETTFKFPSICRLTAYANMNHVLFRTELAGVQQFNINYTPNGALKLLQDGKPLQYQMLLTIKELRRMVVSDTSQITFKKQS